MNRDGYTQIDLWLPQSDHHLATLILNSFRAVPVAAAASPRAQGQAHSPKPGIRSGDTTPAVARVATGIGGVLLLLIALGIGFYFLPTIIALARQHHQRGAVFAVNLLLGWTLIGWAVALAMAMSAKRQPPVMVSQVVYPTVSVATAAPAGPAPGPPAVLPPTWPAGWYPDPRMPGQLRRWDGANWTAEVRPA